MRTKDRLFAVRIGEVFYIDWYHKGKIIYKCYEYVRPLKLAMCVALDLDIDNRTRFTCFRCADDVKEDKIYLLLGENFKGECRILPKLKAMLYEPKLDNYWKSTGGK